MHRLSILLPLAALLLSGCLANPIRPEPQTVLAAADSIASDQRLDLWVEKFASGELPEDAADARGLSPDIRKAEARYIPIHLARTLERSGYWGAVRVVSQASEGFEALVQGQIRHSDGERLELAIIARDARGEIWFERAYVYAVTAKDYRRAGQNEAFQPLYNHIANDLSQHFAQLTTKERRRIRQVAELRFARDMAPDAFTDYLEARDDDLYRLQRLPAANDPHLERVRAIRTRDQFLIDALNGHLNNYYRDMGAAYADWRRARAVEAEQLRAIETDARNDKILGGLAVLGGIVLSASGASDDATTQALKSSIGQLMVLGGVLTVQEGIEKAAETTIHKVALEELGDSFEAETQPLVVDIEGQTHRLTGSAETQYAQWRDLLKRIYAQETALIEPGGSPD